MASSSRRPSFSEADDGLASIAGDPFPHSHPFVSRTGFCNTPASTMTPRRRGSLRKLASLSSYSSVSSSPRSMVPGRIFDTRFEEALINPPHFLDSCNLCKKPLGSRDIFMYRGDVPFCSEECRAEQIETDEAMEKSRSLSASMKAIRTKQNDQNSSSSSSPAKSQKYPFRAGIAAA